MPTFNKNNESLDADIYGTWAYKDSNGDSQDIDFPEISDKTETGKPSVAVSQTGDQTKYGRYLGLLLMSVVTMLVVVYRQKKRKIKSECF